MQLLLVSPILPGQTEACRRFVQKINAGWGDAYTASRAGMDIHEERIWIHETATAATVIFLIETGSPVAMLDALARSQHPFDCWFRQQILVLLGQDLAEARHQLMPELVPGWREEQSINLTDLTNCILHTQGETDHVQ